MAALRAFRLPGALSLVALASFSALATSASAEVVLGTKGTDRLIGTERPDVLLGFGSSDYLESRRGDDFLNGGAGRDILLAGPGNDRIAAAFDRSRDRVACSLGQDIVTAERADKVAAGCEVVSRQLSRDPFHRLPAQEGTEVEPDSASHGRVVVATFQVGRFVNGGALAIGFATSKNAGTSWRSGLLPGVTRASRPAGVAEAAADSTVAYDAAHRAWLIASLAAGANTDFVLVSRSSDGLRWKAPAVAVRSQKELDKPWLACDAWPESRFRGHCYVAYRDDTTGGISLRTSTDGGKTWSATTVVVGGSTAQSVNGAQPLIRPDGSVIVAFTATNTNPLMRFGPDQIAVASSVDGGSSFGAQRSVAVLNRNNLDTLGLRSAQFVSGDVDSDGAMYLAWEGCAIATVLCENSEIFFARSRDGVVWEAPARVSTIATRLGIQSFLPALAVDRRTARLAIVYYSMDCGVESCPINARLITSGDGGRTWKPPQRLNPESMPLGWLARTTLGRMLGDYISASYAGGRPVPVIALASAPTNKRFNEAIFASRLTP